METLVLDVDFRPVRKIPWQRALTLLFENKVEVVEEYDEHQIRSVSMTLKMPAVIRFLKQIRRKRAIKFSRENIYLRDGGKCQYCDRRVPRYDFTYDHVIPRSRGGKTSWDNVVVCCPPCNQKKSNKRPEEVGLRLRTAPVKPKSLPDVFTLTFKVDANTPEKWRDYLAGYVYWHAELEQDP